MWKFIWQNEPNSGSNFIIINDDGSCKFTNLAEAKNEILQSVSIGLFAFTNSLLFDGIKGVVKISNSFLEFRHYLMLTLNSDYEQCTKVPSSLIEIIKRFVFLYAKLNDVFKEVSHQNKYEFDKSVFKRTIEWVSRTGIRIYPNESVQDRHVYCTRWLASHWSELIRLGFICNEPVRDAKSLKGLRTDPARVKFLEGCGFLLIKFLKMSRSYDYPLNVPVWITNIELMALIDTDNTLKFEVEDVLIANLKELNSDQFDLLNDQSMHLSASFGMALKSLVNDYPLSWTKALWASVERARWISLSYEINKKYPIQVSGIGDGSISFYCWSGDIANICQFIRVRASVLKQTDYDIEEMILDEISVSVINRLNSENHEYFDENANIASI